MNPKAQPVLRLRDQRVWHEKPWIWRCNYPECGYVAVERIKSPYPGADHVLYAHYREEVQP